MSRRFALIIALSLVGPALTGCLGIGGEDETSTGGLDKKSRAEVSSETGGIEGVVTDSAVQAVSGVTVTIEELGETSTTADDGSFAFSNLQPATYTLNLTKEGFIGSERTVEVTANQVSTVEVVLARVPTIQPFTQQYEFKGFLECSFASPVVAGNACAFSNATNTKFIFFPEIESNPWQITTELQWEPTSPAAEELALIVEPEGINNDDQVTFAEDEGTSPLVLTADRNDIVDVIANLTAICSGEKEPSATSLAASESYCNRRYVQEGGRLQIRVFSSGATAAGESTAGAAIQQPFTVVQTLFYNAPACEEYSLFEGNTCKQLAEPPAEDPYQDLGRGNATAAQNNSTG